MKCPICGDEFEPKRADARTCGKSACRKKLQRTQSTTTITLESSQRGTYVDDEFVPLEAPVPAEVLKAPEAPAEETPEEWLARRVIETGSKGWQWVKTGNPAGEPRIKVPTKWELTDIDQAMLWRGQWIDPR